MTRRESLHDAVRWMVFLAGLLAGLAITSQADAHASRHVTGAGAQAGGALGSAP